MSLPSSDWHGLEQVQILADEFSLVGVGAPGLGGLKLAALTHRLRSGRADGRRSEREAPTKRTRRADERVDFLGREHARSLSHSSKFESLRLRAKCESETHEQHHELSMRWGCDATASPHPADSSTALTNRDGLCSCPCCSAELAQERAGAPSNSYP
ncbi:hypothetical protein AGOR_G00121300 [Albula goreensis]|uniref:Uncharacterized protein n=1 Tax=Albula goreensis TaxID=1534307 RepID=A0A8T3DFF3_9TELE|nr:hypothetical protein AGOR_G00121300 [Albula goreensis]